MKKEIRALVLICLMLSIILSGCTGTPQNTEQLFHSDTVITIPLNPEAKEAATEEATVPEETAAETEAPTETTEETKATTPTKTTTTKSSSSKTTSGKTSSSKSNSTSKTTTKATEPPETQPTETQPLVTQSVETAPPETEVPATEAPTEATEAPEMETLPTEVVEQEIPATEVPETEPPVTQSPEEAIYDISDYAAGGLEYGIAEQINACRAAEGLNSLSMSGTLCGIASVRAYEVCLSWSHTRPNGSSWESVLSDYGYGYGVAAEDLVHSAGFDAAAIVSKWMGSDGSRADILNADFTTIGVGVYETGGTTFIAVIFAG